MRKYPYLGYSPQSDCNETLIVLFIKPRTGIVVSMPSQNKDYYLGEFHNTWREKEFLRLNDKTILTLTNKQIQESYLKHSISSSSLLYHPTKVKRKVGYPYISKVQPHPKFADWMVIIVPMPRYGIVLEGIEVTIAGYSWIGCIQRLDESCLTKLDDNTPVSFSNNTIDLEKACDNAMK